MEKELADVVRRWAEVHLAKWDKVTLHAFGRGEIELYARNAADLGESEVVRLVFNDPRWQVRLTNVFMPPMLRHRGLGKALIASIREVTNAGGYDLVAVHLTPGFYRRLVARGATVIVHDDQLLITPETDLSHRTS